MNSPRARWFAKTILVALSVLPLLVVSRDVDIHLGEAQRKAEKKELIASCQDANARSATDKWSNCWTYKYEPDKCTYLYNGDGEGARSTGDEGSFFLVCFWSSGSFGFCLLIHVQELLQECHLLLV